MNINYSGETAQLSLRTFTISPTNDIPTFVDNNIGTIDGNASYFVWKNINMRHLLGDMWDKYDIFSISLVLLNKARANVSIGADLVNRVPSIMLSGLNWTENSAYMVSRRNNKKMACVGSMNFISPTDGGNFISFFSQSNSIFKKDVEITDLEIELLYSVNNSTTSTLKYLEEKPTARFGHFHFVFTIIGLKKDSLPLIKNPGLNKQSARLVLRTYDITQLNITTNFINNSIGRTTANNAYMTWYNINLRNLMGNHFYNKYSKFNITLLNYSQREQSANVNTQYRVGSIFMSGLEWSNQGYDVVTKSNGLFSCIGTTAVYPTGINPQSIAAYSFNNLTFRKGSDIVDITIEIKFPFNSNASGFNEKPNVILGHQVYVFQITGCEGYEN